MVFTAGRGYGLPFIIDHISYVVRDGPRRCLGFQFIFSSCLFSSFSLKTNVCPDLSGVVGQHTHIVLLFRRFMLAPMLGSTIYVDTLFLLL